MKKRMPTPTVHFQVPIYGGDVYLYLSKPAFLKAGLYFTEDAPPGDPSGRCWMLASSEGYAVYLVGWHNGRLSTLVHEAGHLAHFILERAGVDVREGKNEAYCYLLEELCFRLGVDKKPRAKSAR